MAILIGLYKKKNPNPYRILREQAYDVGYITIKRFSLHFFAKERLTIGLR